MGHDTAAVSVYCEWVCLLMPSGAVANPEHSLDLQDESTAPALVHDMAQQMMDHTPCGCYTGVSL